MSQQLILENAIALVRRHGFWFVDIPRTSSSSLRVELGNLFGVLYGKTNVIEKEYSAAQVFQDHIPAKVMRDIFGAEVWDELFTFTLVRNPWDRLLSMYYHRKTIKKISDDLSFRDYVLEMNRCQWGSHGSMFAYHGHYFGMADYIYDDNGEKLVEFIGRYENREQDLTRIAEKIGAGELGGLTVQRGASTGKHYSYYYDDDTRKIVAELYKKDIELFDYEFNSVG